MPMYSFPAATSNMDTLTEEKLIDEDTVVDLLKNDVVLITPKDSKLGIKSFKILQRQTRLQLVIRRVYRQVNTQKRFLPILVFIMR